MITQLLFVFISIQSSIAHLEGTTYQELPESFNIYSDEFLDPDEFDIDKKDNHFMRFGRNLGDFNNKELLYNDYDDLEVPSKRSGNQHVRFGRSSSSSFMRYGRDPNKPRKTKAYFMGIGGSYQDHGEKIRSKRSAVFSSQSEPNYPETEQHKRRRDTFLRFGKSPSFMRYGRGEKFIQNPPSNSNRNHQFNVLLAKLLASREEENKPYDIMA